MSDDTPDGIANLDAWRRLTQPPLDPGLERNHIAVTETAEGNLMISQPSHQVTLTREQAEFVLPHLQRWLNNE